MKKSIISRLGRIVAILGLTSSAAFGQLFNGTNGRIAVTADGNIHDNDDWGATPVTLAILAKRGLQNKLVHYDYSSHIGESTNNGENQMTTSSLGAQQRFGFRRAVFFDDTKNLNGAINNLRNQINASGANNRLYVLLAGPAEVLWRGMNAAQANKRQFVTVVSHSFFNNFHSGNRHTGQPNHGQPNHTQLRRTIDNVRNLGAQVVNIANQNDYWNTHLGGRGGFNALNWMRNHPNANLRWAFNRIQAVGRADYSDAGMMYFLITGNQRATTNTQRNFFAGAFPNPGGGGNGGGNASSLPINAVISLQGSNNRFVSSENGTKDMICNRTAVGGWEKFTVVNAGGGLIALRGSNGKYVSSENGTKGMRCNRNSIGGWEKFTATVNGNQVTLKGSNNRFVSSENGTKAMVCDRTSVGAWERFTWKRE